MAHGMIERLVRDLEAPIEARGFGTGWFAGFFALLLAIAGLCFVVALRWPGWFAMPEMHAVTDRAAFRIVVHIVLIAAYALALLSLLLRPRKVLGVTALLVALAATLLGGAAVQPVETRTWGMFFGVDFFALNLIATGLMFAPLERFFPQRPDQRLFRSEWREDLFYYLVSSMLVQLTTYLALAPSEAVNAATSGFAGFRAAVAGQPWWLQFIEAAVLTDLAQYWFHRAFHRSPFLWGFHAVHHSAQTMDWLAGARMHLVEVVLLRGLTSLPLLTLGFSPAVMQAYIAVIYIYSALVHANLRGNFRWLDRVLVTPRFHHWHHAIEPEAVDKNFAVHFPQIDRLFGTYYMPGKEWPSGYGVPEAVPKSYRAQLAYPFRGLWGRSAKS